MVPVPASKPAGMCKSSNIGRLLFGVLLVIQSVAVASAEEPACHPAQPHSQAVFEQLLATAERLRKTAAAADAEWLKTESLLVRSRQQATDGNWKAAFPLAQKACLQAGLALQQAAYEAQAWRHRVVH